MCACGPPSEVIRAITFSGSRVAVSAGARSMAASTNGSSEKGMPGACWPVSSATIRARTSWISVTRSAMYPPRAAIWSAKEVAASQIARSGAISWVSTSLMALLISARSVAIWEVDFSTALPSRPACSARESRSSFTRWEASLMRWDAASMVSPLRRSPSLGSWIGSGICLTGPITRPA